MAPIFKLVFLVPLFAALVSANPYPGNGGGLAAGHNANSVQARSHAALANQRRRHAVEYGKRATSDTPVQKRCKPKSSTSSTKSSTTHHTTTTHKAVANVAPAQPTTSKKAAPPPAPPPSNGGCSSNPDDNNGSITCSPHSGDGTFYATGLDACGWTDKDTDFICAVSHILYDNYPGATANPNDNPVCGKMIKATYQGKSVTVKVTDRCTGCSEYSLDFSPSAFDVLADPSIGRIHDVVWDWV